MDDTTLILIAVIALVVIVGAVVLVQRRRSQALRSRYGAEYAAAVEDTGGHRKAEAELRHREKRVRAFDLHPLTPRETVEFSERWRDVQAQFVDDPGMAVSRADALLSEVMRARGYPQSAFEQRADDLSVHHPRLVSDYRQAYETARLHAAGQAGTEDLRRALIHYRALFEDLLGEEPRDRRPDLEPRSFAADEADDRDAIEFREAELERDREDARRAALDRAERQRRGGERDSRL